MKKVEKPKVEDKVERLKKKKSKVFSQPRKGVYFLKIVQFKLKELKMGKRRKRMMMKKYAKSMLRKTLGFAKEEEIIEIDMTTGEEIKEEETVKVVSNKEEKLKVNLSLESRMNFK